MIRIFVYGTLKRGGKLHDWVESLDGKFVSDGVLMNFALYNISWFPGIVPDPQGHVVGELFEFPHDKHTLVQLDNVEAVEAGLFRREEINLNDTSKAWVYIFNQDLPERATLIPSGVWKI